MIIGKGRIYHHAHQQGHVAIISKARIYIIIIISKGRISPAGVVVRGILLLLRGDSHWCGGRGRTKSGVW